MELLSLPKVCKCFLLFNYLIIFHYMILTGQSNVCLGFDDLAVSILSFSRVWWPRRSRQELVLLFHGDLLEKLAIRVRKSSNLALAKNRSETRVSNWTLSRPFSSFVHLVEHRGMTTVLAKARRFLKVANFLILSLLDFR